MKKRLSLVFALFLAFGFAQAASAHVTVSPGEVAQGAYQVFTIRVPSEKDAATTEVKLDVPDGVEVLRFEPKPEWSYETETNADGKIVSVVWTTSGSGLGATEFGEFRFQGRVAADATELVWKAYQTYSDGSVVEWTGAEDADTPASVTAVTPSTGESDGHGHGAASSGAADEASDGAGRDPLTLGLAIAGLAAGLLALVVSLVRRKA
ncbi:YcnI family protein [Cohnella massiliensis]|uniref:YcnI family copper-binding membrane protein n=1 Tax=Cohnella massiliensis TaxID=1816691 RepID=UPI0009BBB619|nr:YcnI family protein [Cohnella massiliensis]